MNDLLPPARGRVTIREVAQAAGVSKATVSRYLGATRQLLAEATAQRIETVIARSSAPAPVAWPAASSTAARG